MSSSGAKLSAPKRFLIETYAAFFVVLGLSLFPEPVARSNDGHGSVAASLRLKAAPDKHAVTGVASYYHPSLQGLLTSSRIPYDENALTAAHRTLPLGTVVRVFNDDTGRVVDVTINDRGPYVKGRIIDLSRRAAEALGILEDGTADVRLQILRMGDNLVRL